MTRETANVSSRPKYIVIPRKDRNRRLVFYIQRVADGQLLNSSPDRLGMERLAEALNRGMWEEEIEEALES